MLVAFLRPPVLSCWCVGTRPEPTSRSSVHMPTWTLLVVSLGSLAPRTLLSSEMLFVSAMLSYLTGTSSSTMHTGPASLSWGQWHGPLPHSYTRLFFYIKINIGWSDSEFLHCSYSLPLTFLLLLCVRPLWVEYQKDAATFTIDDEFLIGEWF